MTASARCFSAPAALLWLALLATATAGAQQRPLTGQMLGEPAAAPTAPAVAPAAPSVAPPAVAPAPVQLALPARPQIGDTTRALLQLQASGEHAGARLPILGDQASASYARYLRSFNHDIPEYLEKSVRKDVTGGGSGE